MLHSSQMSSWSRTPDTMPDTERPHRKRVPCLWGPHRKRVPRLRGVHRPASPEIRTSLVFERWERNGTSVPFDLCLLSEQRGSCEAPRSRCCRQVRSFLFSTTDGAAVSGPVRVSRCPRGRGARQRPHYGLTQTPSVPRCRLRSRRWNAGRPLSFSC